MKTQKEIMQELKNQRRGGRKPSIDRSKRPSKRRAQREEMFSYEEALGYEEDYHDEFEEDLSGLSFKQRKKAERRIAKRRRKKDKNRIENAKVRKKVKRRGMFYYAFPPNLVHEIHLMGYPFKTKTILFVYIITTMIACVLGYLYKIGNPFSGDIIFYLVLIAAGMLIAPMLIRNIYLNKYEMKRFSDVNIYIEQLLYAFRNSQKIYTSLRDIRILFPQGAMRSAIDEAIEFIATRTDKVDVETEALALIEKRYPNEQMSSVHRFMQKVEELGGENDTSIEILLMQRKNWEQRVYKFIDLKKKERVQIVGSIVATLVLAASMLYILPQDVDVSANPVARIANVILIVLSMLIYEKADCKLSTSLITPNKIRTDKQNVRAYERVLKYNPLTAIMTGLKGGIVPGVVLILNALFFKNSMVSGGGLALLILTLSFGFIRHRTDMKNVKNEVQKAFPQWLLELALLLQSENVQMAIFKTVDTAPAILQPELNKLRDELIADPASSEPFLNFFAVLELPSVTTTMQMLYSLSVGSGGDADQQIINIVDRNNAMLDRAEEIEAESAMASLYSLFFAPMALGALVLIIDMTLFLLSFMGNLSAI